MMSTRKSTNQGTERICAVAVVIVTYQGQHDIERCLRSLIPALGAEDRVYVVDNASTDATREKVLQFDGVTLIPLSTNQGFAQGNNVGFCRAMEDGFDFMYCLNQDTEVDPHFLLPLKAVMMDDKSVGIAQSLLLLGDKRECINSSGNKITWAGFGYSDQYKIPRSSLKPTQVRDIGYASGAGCLIRARVITLTGGFVSEYFMYHEDTALSWEAVLGGYRVVIEPQSVVWHYYHFSSSPRKWYWIERNRFLLVLTHYKIPTLFVLAPFLACVECIMLCMSMKGRWMGNYLRARLWFLTPHAWHIIRRERSRINALRRVTDSAYMSRMTSGIDFQEVSSWFLQRIANPVSGSVLRMARWIIRW